ncbi:MAG: glycosyltransferase family 39 protein [Chloroflexi bacterium]|nr:glycosyltransferase family 39 protein [Chloroflexota bacterium]
MLRANAIAPRAASRIHARAVSLPLALAAMAALLIPLVIASPSHLSSDESLYVAEAFNISHGKGLTYPSGDTITHRAPLYPLLLAPAVRLAGSDGAYGIAKLVVVFNAVLVMALAWRMAGQLAGWITGLAAAASAYLSELGTTLYLDPMQCSFLLLCALALNTAVTSGRWRWYAASGLCLGFAFLIKESAVQWLPLAIVVVLSLPSARHRHGFRGAAVFTLVFLATVAPWWIWLFAQTGQLFLLGDPRALLAEGLVVLSIAAVFAGFAVAIRRLPSPRYAVPAAVLISVTWCAFMIYGLASFSSWGYPDEYLTTIPRYMLRVAPQMQPFFLIAVAWIWVCARAVRGDEPSRMLCAAAALFAPFALLAANDWLQLRDALPLIYLSYAALGIAAAGAWPALRRFSIDNSATVVLAGASAIAAAAFVFHEASVFRDVTAREAEARDESGSWDSPYTRSVATWMEEHLPAGSNVLMSRLYFSGIHVETEGRFHIRQLPTVRVDIDPERAPLLEARSNLFRWGESDIRSTQPGDTWLHLQQFPVKNYWVGLSEQELLEYIAAHDIDYVVLTGEDVAFSSSAYAWYFAANSAFHLMDTFAGTSGDRMFAFSVTRSLLAPVSHSTSVTPRGLAALERDTGLDAAEIEHRLGGALRVTDGDSGLSHRELQAALAGFDLATTDRAASPGH